MCEVKEYTKNDMLRALPRLSDIINKFDRGGVLVCGGSLNYRGATLLTAKAALWVGVGYVVLAIPDIMVSSTAVFLPEAIIAPIKTVENKIVLSYLQAVAERWEKRCQSAVFGMGAGRSDETETSHGLAGERLMKKYGVRGALASEIADEIPYVLG